MLIATEKKQSIERLDYNLDYSQWLASDDSIYTFTATASDSALVVEGLIIDKTINLWVGGGVNGVTYKITITVTTAKGRVKEDEFKIKVKDI